MHVYLVSVRCVRCVCACECDALQSVLCMESLSKHAVMRTALIEGKVFPNVAEHLSGFLARALFQSSSIALDGPTKRAQVRYYQENSPMCKLTEEGGAGLHSR